LKSFQNPALSHRPPINCQRSLAGAPASGQRQATRKRTRAWPAAKRVSDPATTVPAIFGGKIGTRMVRTFDMSAAAAGRHPPALSPFLPSNRQPFNADRMKATCSSVGYSGSPKATIGAGCPCSSDQKPHSTPSVPASWTGTSRRFKETKRARPALRQMTLPIPRSVNDGSCTRSPLRGWRRATTSSAFHYSEPSSSSSSSPVESETPSTVPSILNMPVPKMMCSGMGENAPKACVCVCTECNPFPAVHAKSLRRRRWKLRPQLAHLSPNALQDALIRRRRQHFTDPARDGPHFGFAHAA